MYSLSALYDPIQVGAFKIIINIVVWRIFGYLSTPLLSNLMNNLIKYNFNNSNFSAEALPYYSLALNFDFSSNSTNK
ncbi:hypothetical protein BpHYR1_008618 [Brachionus plicatilis]|uniref:Uncharacterized protein n=1 Tax=Brachionus plicatilis TaxID=10195 RepID=A0A3M7S9Q0_BRAPC|nr:hypothetical protein BpHYR1_008618 [Brachionus plicatilis]